MSERGRTRVDGVCRACRGSSPAASTVVQTASRSTVVGCWSWMTVRCESAREQVIVQVSLVVSSSKSRVAATWLGGVDCDVASRQSSSSRIRLGWRHSLDLAGGAAVSTSTRCDRPLHSVLGTGWEASCAKTASILVGAEGRTALLHDLLAGRKKPPVKKIAAAHTRTRQDTKRWSHLTRRGLGQRGGADAYACDTYSSLGACACTLTGPHADKSRSEARRRDVNSVGV